MPDTSAIPILAGPTGAGKTALAIRLASEFPLEVVSADSRQMIRHLDIGTAKPTAEERRLVNFHLLDLIEPGERYSAYRFVQDADRAIAAILSRGRIPMVVGGTGFYLKALVDGVMVTDVDDGGAVKARLTEEMKRLGAEAMHRRLAAVDPAEAVRIHPNNQRRVIRALEIYELTGVSKSTLAASGAYNKSDYRFEFFCLLPEREAMYEQIDSRVDAMMQAGLIKEVEGFVVAGRKNQLRQANVIGYNELLDHMEGLYTLAEAVALIKQNSRRYAKRQVTWFRHQVDGHFFDCTDRLFEALRLHLTKSRWADQQT